MDDWRDVPVLWNPSLFACFFFPLVVLLIYESKNGPLKGHYVIVERKSKLSELNKEAFLEARETK